ncbi:MAG: hypothetical protein GY842_06510 [bacterium]|nr:hypothetical protein [bacterium]
MPYHRPSRTRRIAKWAGLVACAVIVASWYVSTRWMIAYADESTALGGGIDRHALLFCHGLFTGLDGWHVESAHGRRDMFLLPWAGSDGSAQGLIIPLWMLFVGSAGGTAWLWWRDRRPPPGDCQACGYDLTGNTSGVCPECGEAT